MERETRVVVFETNQPAEIQLLKEKLKEKNIESYTQNSYMSFISTPTAGNLKLQVNLSDEQKAFDIIDEYLKETDVNLSGEIKN